MIKILIIGAGKIVRGYDESKSNVALCHLDAISETQENADVHIYDQNRALMEEVCTKWNASVVNVIEDVLNANFDVVLIASPDSTHAYYIQLFSNDINSGGKGAP